MSWQHTPTCGQSSGLGLPRVPASDLHSFTLSRLARQTGVRGEGERRDTSEASRPTATGPSGAGWGGAAARCVRLEGRGGVRE
jgi:hypothetical protein